MSATRIAAALALSALVFGAAAARADGPERRYETTDWVFVAPADIGSQADLELSGRAIQLCTDELKRLLGRRPTNVARFTMQWTTGATNVSYASPAGVTNVYLPGFRLVDDAARAFRERIVAQGLCFGPHEIAHVLAWESFGPAWANEGFATFADHLYESASWRCCTAVTNSRHSCDESGYTSGPERLVYADLSPFTIDNRSYDTAACFWWEIHRLGGFPAVRALLASMREARPETTGELVVQHANVVAGRDLRPVLTRYGFEPDELEAAAPPATPRRCTRLGTDAAEALVGTSGPDVLCGAGGADRLTGAGGADVLRAGAGNDVVRARDGAADAVACGPGRDTVVADRRDRVARDCERVRISLRRRRSRAGRAAAASRSRARGRQRRRPRRR